MFHPFCASNFSLPLSCSQYILSERPILVYDFNCTYIRIILILLLISSYLRTRSSLALLRGIYRKSIRFSGKQMPKMATTHSSKLHMETGGSYGLHRTSVKASGKILLAYKFTRAIRHESDSLQKKMENRKMRIDVR